MFGMLTSTDFDQGTLEYVENPDPVAAVSRNLRDKVHVSCMFCRARKVLALHFLSPRGYPVSSALDCEIALTGHVPGALLGRPEMPTMPGDGTRVCIP